MRKANPYYDPTLYHHTRRGFRNPPGSPGGRRWSAEMAREAAHFMGEMRHLARDAYPFPPDHRLDEDEALRSYYAESSASHRVTWLGHASFLLTLGERRVLTDPFLSDYASPLPLPLTRRMVPGAMAVDKLPRLDLLLISHNHYDHLDAGALRALAESHPELEVVVPLGVGELVTRCGLRRVTELDWYQGVEVAGLAVQALPAVHTSKRGVGDTDRSLWCGFRLADAARSVYFAGDTAYGEVFREIGRRCGPFDLGLVPIGAYQPRVLMRSVHCTPEEAVCIGEDVGAGQLVGMHWGTIRLTTEPMLEPRDRFLAAPGRLDRRVMRIGETAGF